jgi:3-dehydroquinate synthetase
MIIASKVSFYEGHISSNQLQNIINIISSLELNTDHTKYNFSHLDKYIKTDKKVSDGKLNLILINKSLNAFKTSKFNKKNILKALG